MNGAPRSAGGLARKIAAALVVVPLAIIIIAFAVANRQNVTVSLDPFGPNPGAAPLTLPLFALIIVVLIVGVLVGGVAAWLRQSKWRRRARALQREVSALRAQVDSLKDPAEPSVLPVPSEPPPPLRLTPPVR